MMNNLLSVIIPVYNGAQYLAESINSVLQQTKTPDSILVVDDGSTDDTAAVVAAFGSAVHYLHQPNAGAAAARNRGVAASTGEFLAFLDADDLWLPEKLALQMAVMASTPAIDMVFDHLQQFVSPDLPHDLRTGLHCPPASVPGYLPSTLLIRRAAWVRAGALDASWRVGEFIHWYL
ncbi:MAG: glycosyltransferase family 2 protein, partial [Caldilineaceae bacterium]|nr:glycosyltransferase family 2 protein [Caldilineaceae bacterium]